jgi:hypothetical protein
MFKMRASCGDDITDEWEKIEPITIKAYTRECQRATSFGVYCRECQKFYEENGYVLHSREEELAWLMGEDDDDPFVCDDEDDFDEE